MFISPREIWRSITVGERILIGIGLALVCGSIYQIIYGTKENKVLFLTITAVVALIGMWTTGKKRGDGL